MKFVLSILILLSAMACQNKTSPQISGPVYDLMTDTPVYLNEMKRYWLVLLKSGPNRNQDKEAAAKIQAGHMANINRLAAEGKLIMAGPMGNGSGDLRGIFIMDCKDSSEVQAMVNSDTAVMTGRLRMEYYPWWSAKGKFLFK